MAPSSDELKTKLRRLDADRMELTRQLDFSKLRGQLSTDGKDEEHQLDRDRLQKATQSVVDTITSPEFIERMREFRTRAAEGEVPYEDVADLLSIDGLKKAGAQLPGDFRLSSRTFEDKASGLRIEVNPGRLDDERGDPLAWGACAGGGAATVCACAGGQS